MASHGALRLSYVLALVLLASHVLGQGLVATLYDGKKGPSTNLTAVSFVVTPSPIKSTATPTPGCTNLPTGFVPMSAKFEWQSAAGTDNCTYFIFYRLQNCYAAESGNETVIAWSKSTTSFDDLTNNVWRKNATLAKAVGCAYNFNPCVKYPCKDNEICTPKSVIVYNTAQNKTFDQWVSRDCDTCKIGCYRINGSCVCDPCSQVQCPAPGWCVENQGNATCKCPIDWVFDGTQCVDESTKRWLSAINTARDAANVPNVAWNSTLATDALAWATALNASLCQKWKDGESIKLIQSNISKLAPKRSENRAFDGYNNTQVNAVNLWMANSTNAQAARIVSNKTTQAGCGKAACNIWGAFFVCQFSPFTF